MSITVSLFTQRILVDHPLCGRRFTELQDAVIKSAFTASVLVKIIARQGTHASSKKIAQILL